MKDEKEVVLKPEAYRKIVAYASRYANESISSEEWKEVYGMLIGNSDNDYVYAEKAEALTHGQSAEVRLSYEHYGFIEEIQQKLDEEKKGYYIIGWFHSHPGFDLFFSEIDLLNQLGFQQTNPDFIGLVYDPVYYQESSSSYSNEMSKYDTGIEIYRITNINMDINDPNFISNYHKVNYSIEGLNKLFFSDIIKDVVKLVSKGKLIQLAYKETKSEGQLELSKYFKTKDSFDMDYEYNKIFDELCQNPNSFVPYHKLGRIYLLKNDIVIAINLLNRALEINNSDPVLWRDLAIAYDQYQDVSSAIKCLENALKLREDPELLDFLGCMYANSGKTSKAEKLFIKALTLDNLYKDSWYNLILLYNNKRQVVKAKSIYSLAIQNKVDFGERKQDLETIFDDSQR